AGLNPSPVHANGGPGMWAHSSSFFSVPASYAGEYRVRTSRPFGPSTPLRAKKPSLVGTSMAATLTNLNAPRVARDKVTDAPGGSGGRRRAGVRYVEHGRGLAEHRLQWAGVARLRENLQRLAGGLAELEQLDGALVARGDNRRKHLTLSQIGDRDDELRIVVI